MKTWERGDGLGQVFLPLGGGKFSEGGGDVRRVDVEGGLSTHHEDT